MRYMTTLIMALALLLVPNFVSAQGKATPAAKAAAKAASVTPTTTPAPKAEKIANESEERMVLELQAQDRFAFRNPDFDPVVRNAEQDCVNGKKMKIVGQLEILALWGDGHHADRDLECTATGLMPVSQRMSERVYQLLGAKDTDFVSQAIDHLHNGRFIRREYQPARVENGKLVLPKPQPQLPELYGSKGVGTKTDFPPTPIGFTLYAILLDPIKVNNGPHAGQSIQLAITTGYRKDDGEVVQSCINFTGEFAFTSVKVEEVAKAEPAPQASPVTPPAAPMTQATKPVEPKYGKPSGMLFDAGIAYRVCNVNSSYSGASQPGTGDATQHNNCSSWIPHFRVEPAEGKGLFAQVRISVADKTGPKYFDDPVQKIRQNDVSKDQDWEGIAGWQFNLKGVDLAVFGGVRNFGLNEEYDGQGAHTITKRNYRQGIGGAQVRFTANERVTVRIRGTYGRGTRTQWTQQTMPGYNFPQVTQPDASASSIGLRPEVQIGLTHHLSAVVTYDYLHVMSQRTNTFAANESFNANTMTFGISYGFGRK